MTTLMKLSREQSNPVYAYLASLAEGSRRAMLTGLRAAVASITHRHTSEVPADEAVQLPWWELSASHVDAIRSQLQEKHSPAYANKVLASIRGVFKHAWKLGKISREQFERSTDVPRVQGERLPTGRALTAGEIALLFQVCARDPHPNTGIRDGCILAIFLATGIRIGELSALNVEDYDPDSGTLIILHGKSNKQRQVYLSNGSEQAMIDWLAIRGQENGPLFVRLLKSGSIVGGRVSSTSIRRMLSKRQQQAGVPAFTAHDLRRTHASNLLDLNVDLAVVQALMGHSSPAVTVRYDRRPAAVRMAAAARLQVPYVPHVQQDLPSIEGDETELF